MRKGTHVSWWNSKIRWSPRWSLSPTRTPSASSSTQWKTRLDKKRIAWTSRELVHFPEWSKVISQWKWSREHPIFFSTPSIRIYPHLNVIAIYFCSNIRRAALRCCHCGLCMWMFLILPTRHQHFLHSLEEDANSTASFLSPNQVRFIGQIVTCKTNLPATFYLRRTFSEMWGSSPQSAWPGFNSWAQKLDRFFYDLRFWKIGARTSCHTMQTEKPDEIGGPHSGQGGPDCAPSPSNLHRCNGIGLAVWHLRADTVSLPAWASLRRELENASSKWLSTCQNSQICSPKSHVM